MQYLHIPIIIVLYLKKKYKHYKNKGKFFTSIANLPKMGIESFEPTNQTVFETTFQTIDKIYTSINRSIYLAYNKLPPFSEDYLSEN